MNIQTKLISFLRWSERYTKTDMVYLVTGASWLTLTQMIASIFGFIIVFVLANVLSPKTLGDYRFLMTGFTLLCVFALPGMRTAIRESVPKGYTGNLSIAFWAMFRWGLVGSFLSFLTAGYFFLFGDPNLGIGFMLIAVVVPIYNATTGYSEYLIATKELRLNTFYSLITRFFTLISTLAAAIFAPNFVWFLLGVALLATVIPNLIFHVKTLRKNYRSGGPKDPKLISYAKHLSVMTALGLVAGQLDKILVWNVIGAEALAFFYIAQTIPQNIAANLNTIPTLAFAKFGSNDPQIIKRTLLPKIFKYFLAIAATSCIYIFVAPYLFRWLFPTYLNALPYSIALACIPVFGALLPLKTYLTSIKATKQLYVVSIIPPTARVLVALSLVTSLGLWGVVWAMLSEAIMRSTLLLYYFLKS